MLRLAVVAALVLAMPAVAAAQPAAPSPEPAPVAEAYDPNVALALSLGTTLAGYGALAAGAVSDNDALAMVGAMGAGLGPSLGHWYSGHVLSRGLGLRVLGVASGIAGAWLLVSRCPIFKDEGQPPCEEETLAITLGVAGAGLFVAGTLDDIFTAPGEARRRNQRRIAVAPLVTPDQAGLAVMGSF
jgi:hypothetical protein